MKRSIFYLSAVILAANLVFAQTVTDKYGEPLSLKDKTKISDIIDNPEAYLDKTVLVEGEVLDVCSMAGCWIEISSDKEGQKIKVKVEDGEIVFPQEAKGKAALVEGKVYKIELSKEEAIDYYKNQAEEKGVDFDPLSISGPVTIYQIKGSGAEIKSEG